MLDTIRKFEIGNTVYFECLYRNLTGFPFDPQDPTYEIEDIKGAKVATGTPSKRKDGIWYCFWKPLLRGDYLLIFKGKIEGNEVVIRKKFKIIETRLK